jgi:hypothetical protein
MMQLRCREGEHTVGKLLRALQRALNGSAKELLHRRRSPP